jgi:hypothetical protein
MHPVISLSLIVNVCCVFYTPVHILMSHSEKAVNNFLLPKCKMLVVNRVKALCPSSDVYYFHERQCFDIQVCRGMISNVANGTLGKVCLKFF